MTADAEMRRLFLTTLQLLSSYFLMRVPIIVDAAPAARRRVDFGFDEGCTRTNATQLLNVCVYLQPFIFSKVGKNSGRRVGSSYLLRACEKN